MNIFHAFGKRKTKADFFSGKSYRPEIKSNSSNGNGKHDSVNHPPHYTNGDVECIDAIESATKSLDGFEGMCTGNAIKYLWRWKEKGGVKDLNKSIWYINRLIAQVEKKS